MSKHEPPKETDVAPGEGGDSKAEPVEAHASPSPASDPSSAIVDSKAQKKRAEKAARTAKAAQDAALAKAMPELNTILKESGFTPAERTDWLGHLATLPVSEAEVVAIVDEKAKAAPSKRKLALRRQLTIFRHGFTRWRRSRNLIFWFIYAFGWLYLLLSTATKLGWGILAILSVAGVVVAKVRFVLRDAQPKNMQLITRGYNERKVALQGLLETAQRWYQTRPTNDQIDQYRREALALIASYVRDHRARFGSREILANLLVRDGENVVVVGRSDGLRPVPQTYTREQCALVWEAIATCTPQITGDLYADFPNTVPGKKYCSILVLPVWFRGQVVGAVSIDSHERYHFHLDFDDLQVQLSPYVQLLALSLIATHDSSVKALTDGTAQ